MNRNRNRPRLRHILLPLAFVIGTHSAAAEEVRVFTQPPSADEMGKLLFPDKAVNRPKTRSLTFTAVNHKPQAAPADSIAIALPVQFDFDSARLRKEARAYLDEIGRMLTMDRFKEERILIEGHTDANGPESYNDLLSRRRANAVKQYLTARFAVEPGRLQIAGRGENHPLPGKTPFDPLNRRVELHRVQP